MGEDQRNLEGFAVLSKEDLKAAVREVLQEEGVLGAAKREAWDREYKGDEHWLEFRARVLRLVNANGFVTWGLLDQDPWFRQDPPSKKDPKADGGGMQQPVQWARAVTQHLVPNKPEADDGVQLVAFQLRDNGTRYLTRRDGMHCAAAKAAEGREDAAGLVRHLRGQYDATSAAACYFCRRRYEGETVEDSLQLPVSTHGPEGEVPLMDEEIAVLEASKEGSNHARTG